MNKLANLSHYYKEPKKKKCLVNIFQLKRKSYIKRQKKKKIKIKGIFVDRLIAIKILVDLLYHLFLFQSYYLLGTLSFPNILMICFIYKDLLGKIYSLGVLLILLIFRTNLQFV